MEYKTEDSVVHFVLIIGFLILYIADETIEETQRTAQIFAQRSRGDVIDTVELLDDRSCLLHGFDAGTVYRKVGNHGVLLDWKSAFCHQLHHESAHFIGLCVVGCIIICKGDVASPLHHAMEIVGEYAHLILHRGQTIRLSYAVRNERSVIHALWDVAFIGREYEHMVKVEQTSLQYAHYLNAHYRFTMERHVGGTYYLEDKTLQRHLAYVQFATLKECVHASDELVHTEYRLLHQLLFA